jgi:hypothetical protein
MVAGDLIDRAASDENTYTKAVRHHHCVTSANERDSCIRIGLSSADFPGLLDCFHGWEWQLGENCGPVPLTKPARSYTNALERAGGVC